MKRTFVTAILAALVVALGVAIVGGQSAVEAALYPFNVNVKVKAQGESGVAVANMPDVTNLLRYRIAPANADTDGVRAAITLGAAAQTVTTGILAVDVPRVLSVTGNTGGITGNVTVTGKNIAQETITNTIALSGASTVAGTKAFKSVTSITFPAKTNVSGDTVIVGTRNVFGVPHKLPGDGLLLAGLFDNADDTGGSFAASSTAVELNLYTAAGTPNGAKYLDLLYFYVKD